jgi:hypothetical protein
MFEPGKSGNPVGRPKGSYGGRIQALASLDKLLARKKSKNALIRALELELHTDPVRFFKTVIMPLLPRESRLSFDRAGVIRWQSLLGTTEDPPPKPTPPPALPSGGE